MMLHVHGETKYCACYSSHVTQSTCMGSRTTKLYRLGCKMCAQSHAQKARCMLHMQSCTSSNRNMHA